MALERKVTVRVDIAAQSTVGATVDRDNQKIAQMQATLAKKPPGATITPPAPGQQRPATVMPTTMAAGPPLATPVTTQPATVQDRLASRLAMRGQRAEFIGGEGAALFQQVALQEERVRGEQRVAQARAALINMSQAEEASQVKLETLLGAKVEKQRQLLNLQARLAIAAGPDRGLFEQVAGLNAIGAAQQQVIQSRGQLFAMQSPQGRLALIQQATLGRQIAREQRTIDLESRFGRTGGAAIGLAMESLPAVGAIIAAATAGAVLFRAAISGLPAVTQQLDGSMGSLRNEIGLALTPAARTLSGVFQQTSSAARLFNESTFGRGFSSGLSDFLGGAFGGIGANIPVKPQIDLGGQRGELGSGVEALQLERYQGTEDQRRQETEAFQKMAGAVDRFADAINDRIPPREGL